MLFGIKTESAKNILKSSSQASNQEEPGKELAPKEESPRKKGHGRNGVASYPSAPRIPVPHEGLKPGDPCPLCPKGKLYPMPPEVVVRMQGHAPIEATVYELEKLRCSPCGAIFTARISEEIGGEKYDESTGAVIACMKYGSGFPFYRLERHQESMGVPLAASTQWDIVEGTANHVHPAYLELFRQGAQGEILHNDDTSMRILSLAKELALEDAERKGIFTTGIVSILDEHKIALFFTGNQHAGENLRAVLQERAAGLGIPLQMCDALNRNEPKDFAVILSNCLTHARRNFVDVHASFPEECGHMIQMLGKIYHNDEITKERGLSPQERLEYHRIHSGPVMDELKVWCSEQLEQKKVEPNSGLGKAIDYMLKRWDRFTLFLQIPGAPLDNNICEQALKRAVLHRKNSLFYKTEHGAYIGDMFMSIIHTCSLCGANAFHYLVTLQKHSDEVRKHPELWLPWNYLDRIDPHPG